MENTRATRKHAAHTTNHHLLAAQQELHEKKSPPLNEKILKENVCQPFFIQVFHITELKE